jgi:hypothetical protein
MRFDGILSSSSASGFLYQQKIVFAYLIVHITFTSMPHIISVLLDQHFEDHFHALEIVAFTSERLCKTGYRSRRVSFSQERMSTRFFLETRANQTDDKNPICQNAREVKDNFQSKNISTPPSRNHKRGMQPIIYIYNHLTSKSLQFRLTSNVISANTLQDKSRSHSSKKVLNTNNPLRRRSCGRTEATDMLWCMSNLSINYVSSKNNYSALCCF